MGSFFLMLLSKRLLLKLQELCQELHLNPCPFMCFTCMPLKMYTLSGSGKTLYGILTVAGAMPLLMAGLRVDQNLSRHVSVRPFLQRHGCRVPMRANSGSKTMPSGHTSTLSRRIGTSVTCHPPLGHSQSSEKIHITNMLQNPIWVLG